MSSNLDAVRSVYQAFAAGNIPAVLAALSPDIRWTEAEGGPYGGVFIGPNAVLENVFMKLGGEWDGFAAVPAEFVTGRSHCRGARRIQRLVQGDGQELQGPFAHVWKFKDGKAVSFHQYTDTAVHQRPLQA